MDYQKISKVILLHLGGKNNLKSYTNCMTRLRVYLNDKTKANISAIQALPEVMGIVDGEQIQIILGAGHAQAVKEIIDQQKQSPHSDTKEINQLPNQITLREKTKNFLQKIGTIFVPIMPFFIIYGFLALLPQYAADSNFSSIASQLQIIMQYGLLTLIGYHSAKTFSATAVYGAMLAIIIAFITQLPIDFYPVKTNFLALENGITLAIIFGSIVLAKIETLLKKHIPQVLSFYLLPPLTLLCTTLITAIIILPIASSGMTLILILLEKIMLTKLGAIGGFILSFSFLPTVILGIHQMLYPLHIQLLLTQGGNYLFPILATAGAGQLGMALALYIANKTEREKIRKVLLSSLFGMNEPLIMGIAYPRFYPLVSGIVGGAFGGAFLGFLYQAGTPVLATTIGPSGLLMLPYILHGAWLNYILALVIAYIGGFICTLIFGRKSKI